LSGAFASWERSIVCSLFIKGGKYQVGLISAVANNEPSSWGTFAKNLFLLQEPFTAEFKQGGCVNVFGSATVTALNPFPPSLSSACEGRAAVLVPSKYNAVAVQYAASAPNYLGGTGLIYPMNRVLCEA
jgi:hypothetical protein